MDNTVTLELVDDPRHEFFVKARRDRYKWAQKVDTEAVAAFEVNVEARRKDLTTTD